MAPSAVCQHGLLEGTCDYKNAGMSRNEGHTIEHWPGVSCTTEVKDDGMTARDVQLVTDSFRETRLCSGKFENAPA
jgi:hypothetical protein